MTENLISAKKLTGTRVIKGKKLPRSAGKVHRFIFYPDQKRVAGFETKKSDFLLMFKRRGRFVSVSGYYMYEDYAFIRNEKGTSGKAAYKALNLYPDDSVLWIGLPVITEDGESIGVVNDVVFVLPSGEVQSIEAGPKAVGKLTQGTRSIPTELIVGYSAEGGSAEAAETAKKKPSPVLIVASEALAIDIDSEKSIASKAGKTASVIAAKAGVDAAAVSEKAKSAAETAGAVASAGATAAGEHLKKTRGMFSAFKDAYNEGRHGD